MHRSPEASTVDAFWCRYPSQLNFGDALTPWLVKRVTGRHPNFRPPRRGRPVLFAAGSIIAQAAANCKVWGSGILHRADLIQKGVDILAVRGPLTRQRALACGVTCPEIYGDPARLLPRFFQPKRPTRAWVLGVIPHFLDKAKLLASWQPSEEVTLIDVQRPVEEVVERIASCGAVVSSSLHGIIVAHAYGVPALWVRFSDLPHGDGVKFHDYFRSVGVEPYEPIRPSARGPFEPLRNYVPTEVPGMDLAPLWNACPFRLEQ